METATAEPNAALTAVQAAFEKAAPLRGTRAAKASSTAPVEPQKPVPEPAPAPAPTPEPAPEKPKTPEPEYKLPSFVLGEEPAKPATPVAEEEPLPVEAPAGSDEKTKLNWKKARDKIDRQEAELKELRAKAQSREEKGKAPNEAEAQRIADLERENTEYKQALQRQSIENHPQFINQVLRPLQASYTEAKRIISDAGGDESALDRALVATGKAHYDAMDEILSGLPESAKVELTSSIRDWRKFNQQRQNALANAPKLAEDMKRADEARQLQAVTEYQKEMDRTYEDVVKHSRDVVGFELLRKSDNPEHAEWNGMVDKIVDYGRELLRSDDKVKMAQACVFAPAAMTLRDLWKRAEQRASRAEKELAALRSSEPSMSSSGSPNPVKDDDLKIPFEKLLIQTLHKQTGR